MNVKSIKIEALKPYPNNPRKNADAVDKVANSIRKFGFKVPIIIDSKYEIVAGHTRLLAAKKLGMTEVDCIIADDLNEEEIRAFRLADNKSAEFTEWDMAALKVELGLIEMDMTQFGFAASIDLDDMKENESDIGELLKRASFVEIGDVWTLGRHRLICGDATKPGDVGQLMQGEKADLCVTDPPYGINFRAPTTGLTLMNDNLKGEEFYKFLLASFKNILDNLVPGGSAYVFHADTEGMNFRRAFADAGFHLSGVCIWVKNSFTFGRSVYQWAHEPVLYGFKKGAAHQWFSGRGESTVWPYDKPQRNDVHGTMKPIPLISYPIKNSSPDGGLVIDFFGGSGSTIISAEQLNRRCYMMELDPKFASVILRRYVQFVESSENVFVVRDGATLPYEQLVKEI